MDYNTSMDTNQLVDFLIELTYLLVVLGIFLSVSIAKGKQALINIILSLYLGLLLSLQFPYYEQIFSSTGAGTESAVRIVIFIIFCTLSFVLFRRLMPREYDEKAFEGFKLKFLFALGGTVLVMAFSYNALPITEFITPGSPIQTLFSPPEYFFWWLLTPLGLLFLL